jgi:hypothetical protein
MRLTLRTLLAWLDDTLPPGQVKEIGKQVSESPYAKELVERIHRVTRQRRLTVPGKSGPEATDPNEVAGYVDNDLEPDKVADYEKKCLVSDVNLAEAASVHQILSLLGQKVLVPAEAKSRMYQLVKGRETVPAPRPDGVKPPPREPVTKPIQPWVVPEPPRRSLLERFGPVAACLALIAILSWSAYESLTPSKPDTTTVSTTEPAAVAGSPAAQTQQAGTDLAGTAPPADRAGTEGSMVGQPGAQAPKESAITKDTAQATASEVDTIPKAQIESSAKAKSEPSKSAPARTVPIPVGALGAVEKSDGIFLRYNPEKREWERIGDGTSLSSTDRLLCLAPFRARIVLGKLPLTLIGETHLRLTAKNQGDDPSFELLSGRVLVDDAAPPGRFKAEFSGRVAEIERKSQTTLGLERTAQWRYGQPANQPPGLLIYAQAGEHGVTLDRATETLPGPGTLQADSGGKLVPKGDKSVPSWVSQSEASLKDQKLGEQFLKLYSADRPVLTDTVGAAEDESPVMRKMAIQAIKALGDLSFLMPILSRPNDVIARQSAASALREYLALGPQAQKRLKEQLEEEFRVENGQLIEKLLVGYSPEEASSNETLRQLVDLLSPTNNSLAVRELALESLKTLTGRGDMGYDPENPAGNGYNAWKNLFSEGALKANLNRKPAR